MVASVASCQVWFYDRQQLDYTHLSIFKLISGKSHLHFFISSELISRV